MAYPKFTASQPKYEADISNGDFYRSSVFSETVADNGFVNYFIKTNTQGIQLSVEVQAGGLCEMTVTEGASMENAGTNNTVFNLNRISANISTASVTLGNSWSNGTIIYEDVLGEAVTGNAAGGGESQPGLIILAGSEHYNVAAQNLSGGSTNVEIAINFTDVN